MLELTPKFRVGTITLRDPEGQSELKLQLLPFFVGDQGIQGIQGIPGIQGDPGVYVGTTPPPLPDIGDVWIDTS